MLQISGVMHTRIADSTKMERDSDSGRGASLTKVASNPTWVQRVIQRVRLEQKEKAKVCPSSLWVKLHGVLLILCQSVSITILIVAHSVFAIAATIAAQSLVAHRPAVMGSMACGVIELLITQSTDKTIARQRPLSTLGETRKKKLVVNLGHGIVRKLFIRQWQNPMPSSGP